MPSLRRPAPPRGALPVGPLLRKALAAAAPAVLLLSLPAVHGDTMREVRLVMGTLAEVEASGDACSQTALLSAFAALGGVDERMSLWKESELARLNDAGSAAVSEETFAVLRHALDVAAASGGAFDPTVEPLVRAAGGFGAPPRALSAPERRALLARVGHGRVLLDGATRRVTLEGGARLVLDGIAKGYAADRALSALRAAGAATGLVNLGESSLGVFGEPLTLDLRDPRGTGLPWGAFQVEDASVSTSGTDQRPGHVLDPRTGLPARGVLAATVVAASGVEADALSTAVFVLGPSEGLALLARRGAAGLVLLVEDGRRLVRTTPGFAIRYGLAPAAGVEVQESPPP